MLRTLEIFLLRLLYPFLAHNLLPVLCFYDFWFSFCIYFFMDLRFWNNTVYTCSLLEA